MSKMISVKDIFNSLHAAEEEIQSEVFRNLNFGKGATNWQSETLSLIHHWMKRLVNYDCISRTGKLHREMMDDFWNQSASSYLTYL